MVTRKILQQVTVLELNKAFLSGIDNVSFKSACWRGGYHEPTYRYVTEDCMKSLKIPKGYISYYWNDMHILSAETLLQ